jgi:hypothetical protein
MFQQYTIHATRISLVVLMSLQFAVSGLVMPRDASAQQHAGQPEHAGQPLFVPPAVKAVDSKVDTRKLRAMANPARLSPPEKMKLLKGTPTVSPLITSKSVWKPLLRLTPRNSFVSNTLFEGYWYFNQVAFFTPHWWDDEGVALFVSPLENGTQMVLRFAGQPNQAYAVDVTLGIPGQPSTNRYKVVIVPDGRPDPPKEFKVGPNVIEHLLFDLAPSTSGEYIVTITSIEKEFNAWWYFISLEAGMLQ